MPKLVKSIDKKDDYTVVMTLTEPNVAILANLAMDFATIQSAEFADAMLKAKTPEQFDQIPVGTGPFSFVAYQKDAVIRFKANPDYWGGKPLIDDLVYAITPDADGALFQAQDRRMPCGAVPAPGRPSRDAEGPRPQRHVAAGPQHRLSGLQRAKAALRQEGGAPGAQHGDRQGRHHQGRLSRRRPGGQEPDPADDVVLQRQGRGLSLRSGQGQGHAGGRRASRRRSTSTSGTCRCSGPTIRTPSASPR